MALKETLPVNRALLRTGDRVAVGVSGGADSTALLLTLHEQAAAFGIGISAAHLHHGIRGAEADGDLAFLRELCARLDIPLHVEHAEVTAGNPASADAASRARQGERESLEEAARNTRLAFFDRLMAAGTATAVATAHTEDDQAETVMMKLLRGAWTEGLGGISPVVDRASGRIIRPLLNATRAHVVSFLQDKDQTWREDSSNSSDKHTRNRVRAQLMPLLREFNPSIGATLSATAQLAREEHARWQPEIARLLTQLALPGKPVRGGGRSVGTQPGEESVAFELERLRSLDLPTRRRLLRGAAERMGVRLGSAETLRLLQFAGLAPADAAPAPTVPSKPNSRLDFAGGMRVERSLRELRLSRTA
ncbi:tRNA lysidine(34) synthetase TilS [Terriglobus roseus]|uniref:tRNA(Ile)-lysidine synthase n=1 Tax=Terriglobus roseus TaxID=392734 RepID=A0A1H4L2Q5_9BACT|nr:tRNA lysidine(34) synthetase TilS [Terriglobus roseus]SEB65011.1 tRNA(Ile)-lysidine synthase [Terriglobus roseus]